MTEDQRHNPKLLVGIIGGLTILIAVFFAYQWLSNNMNKIMFMKRDRYSASKPAVATPIESMSEA